MDYYSFTNSGGMESWVGLIGWPIAESYQQIDNLSTIDQAQIRKSPPAKVRCPNQ